MKFSIKGLDPPATHQPPFSENKPKYTIRFKKVLYHLKGILKRISDKIFWSILCWAWVQPDPGGIGGILKVAATSKSISAD